ncbi:MAG: ABC transporter permease [Burkholderiaceae bacterium]|nr:ABC transporter permease [Microbacteriaceae bacterium]
MPTLVAVLILFAGTVSLFATTGLAAASQQRTLERINSPEGRLITVIDAQGEAGLSPESVSAVRFLSGVDWAIGVGPTVDVANATVSGGGGSRGAGSGLTVPSRAVYGELPTSVLDTGPRILAPGQALSGPGLAAVLALGDGVGPVAGRTIDAVVVGGFRAGPPVTMLNDSVLISRADSGGPAGQDRLLTLWVSVGDVSQIAAVTEAVRATLIVADASHIRIETSSELAQLSVDVVSDLAHSARLTVGSLLVAVAILIATVQFGRVSGMARDIGRRRALGATRTTIVLHILISAGLCAVVGAAAGTATGLVVASLVAGTLPPTGFTIGVPVLMVLAALTGSVPPAIRAARLDPVRILRVP